jgi:hypothetical protein
LLLASVANAEFANYYIARDQHPTLASGAYAGEANPNFGRLTFLFAHPNETTPASNHFHGIGVHTYVGALGEHELVTTNVNNRIPETYTLQAPLTLSAGEGLYEGKWASAATDEHYSDLRMLSIADLSTYDPLSPEGIMYNSSSGRYQGDLDGALVALELVAITDGLHVGDASDLSILDGPSSTVVLGGGETIDFTPVFWADANAAPGVYSATFRLIDVSTADGHVRLPDSGTFHVDFAVVPEPSTWMLLVGGGLLAYPFLLRKRGR